MNREEAEAEMSRQALWLQKSVPPDDVYVFAIQALWAAEFFISQWAHDIGIEGFAKAQNNPVINKWLSNILTVKEFRESNTPFTINLSCKEPCE